METIPVEIKKYFENRRKIIRVTTKDNYSLELTFDNQEIRIYEMVNELDGVFAILKDISKFQEAFIDENGNIAWDKDKNVDSGVVWNNRIDLCKDSLYLNSKPVDKCIL